MTLKRPLIRKIISVVVLINCCFAEAAAKRVHHYIFFGMDREKIKESTAFHDTKTLEGAQVVYSWRQLEPGMDEYDFSLIREDLKFLKSKGKKLWIQFQDVSFSPKRIHVPKYC